MSHVFRKRALARKLACAAGLSMFFTTATLAQQPADHSQHGGTQTDHSKMDHAPQAPMHGMDHGTEKKKPAKKKAAPKQSSMPGMDHDKKPGVQGHSGMTQGDMQMKGFLGPYAATREGSGTSWLPDATPHEGLHGKAGDWMTMIHGQVNLVYDHQGGPRGGTKTFVPGMLMGMAQKETADGAIGLRAMISPDPFMGASGYPLLFATGESANGRDHLVDRQHPHDLFMELAATYRKDLSANSSVFVYGGLPGEPALGPPAFMHRTSGMDIPEAPITHHWLDSTHITFGVVTAGLIIDNWKLEGSAFRGREPDQYRYDIEAPKLDSGAARLSWNPTKEWSMQVSYGRLKSPEQLDPQKNEDRFTASAIYTTRVFGDNVWSTTFAWGRKMLSPGAQLNGYLVESALLLTNGVTLFGRAERVQENELLEADAAASIGLGASPIFTVSKVTGGGIYDFYRTDHAKFGVGALVSAYDVPGQLRTFYGDPTSAMIFARLKVM